MIGILIQTNDHTSLQGILDFFKQLLLKTSAIIHGLKIIQADQKFEQMNDVGSVNEKSMRIFMTLGVKI